jgi:hypothetical protein
MKKIFSGKLLLHVFSILGLLILTTIYCKPVLDNKKLAQHDLIQATGAAQEIEIYHQKHGSYPLWTNSMFGGMPAYTIKGEYPNAWTSRVAGYISYILPDPINYIFMLLGCFYIAMIVMGFNPIVSFLGAVAFGFSSYSLVSLEAGHASKVLAVAYAAPLTAGILTLYRGEYFKGALITALFMMLELYSNHIQITYYLAIALIIYSVIEFVRSILAKKIKQFFIASSIIIGISIVILGSMATRFWVMYEYQKYTIRGPSELTSKTDKPTSTGGLDRDYAFNWSYGVAETFTYLIPDFNGGKSGASLNNKSAVYETIKEAYGKQNAKQFAEAEQWPIYWGDQPGTSGPAYMGAVICLLVVLALFVIKDATKWWMFGIIVFFSMLSWGKNFEALNYAVFDHFPIYNKFRAVTMIHAVVALFMVWLAVWGADELLKTDKVQLIKYLKISVGSLGGLLVIFWLFGSSLFTFEKSDEVEAEASKKSFVESWTEASKNPEFANSMYEALLQDRMHAFSSDSLRSLLFVLLAGGLLYAYAATDYIKIQYVLILLVALVVFDEWQVGKRYLNDADFKKKKSLKNTISSTLADDEILRDPDPDYRVMNLTVSTFNDASTSFFHKSIGGYSAAKLRRYQDLIDHQISKNNMNVLNMLNTKYFIVQNPSNGSPMVQVNREAYGHVWFVSDLKVVKNADEEMASLDSLNPKKTAVISESYDAKLGGFKPVFDSTASIQLTSYTPDHLVYESNGLSDQMAVFSEIYYNSGLGWNASIDGKPADHVRVDYILRGMKVPAGKHKIEFIFKPETYFKGEKISLIFSILFVVLIGATGFMMYRESLNKAE